MYKPHHKAVAILTLLYAAVNADVSVSPVTEEKVSVTPLVWDKRENMLFFLSLEKGKLCSHGPSNNMTKCVYLQNYPSALAMTDEVNTFLIGEGRTLSKVTYYPRETDDEDVVEEVEIDQKIPDQNSVSFIAPDKDGRLLVSTYTDRGDHHSRLYSFNSNEEDPQMLADDLKTIFAFDLNQDNNKIYFSSGVGNAVFVGDYDADKDTVENLKQIYRGTEDARVGGIAMDKDGKIWTGLVGSSTIVQLDPASGEVLQTVNLPVKNPALMVWGGENLDILYVSTLYNSRETSPLAGNVISIEGLGTSGVPCGMAKGF